MTLERNPLTPERISETQSFQGICTNIQFRELEYENMAGSKKSVGRLWMIVCPDPNIYLEGLPESALLYTRLARFSQNNSELLNNARTVFAYNRFAFHLKEIVKEGDRVSIKGLPLQVERKKLLLATSVKKADQTYTSELVQCSSGAQGYDYILDTLGIAMTPGNYRKEMTRKLFLDRNR